VPHHGERRGLEARQIAHVAVDEAETGLLALRELAHGAKLPRRDVEQCHVGAELREDDGVPPAARGQRQDARTVEFHAAEAAARVHEAAHAVARARRPAYRTGVRNARSREAIPHPPVVLDDAIGLRSHGRHCRFEPEVGHASIRRRRAESVEEFDRTVVRRRGGVPAI
jgi:hypothetical protein